MGAGVDDGFLASWLGSSRGGAPASVEPDASRPFPPQWRRASRRHLSVGAPTHHTTPPRSLFAQLPPELNVERLILQQSNAGVSDSSGVRKRGYAARGARGGVKVAPSDLKQSFAHDVDEVGGGGGEEGDEF